MKTVQNRGVAIVATMLLVASISAVGAGDDGWTDVAEFSLVSASGNAENTTFGFKNELGRRWDESGLVFKMGGIKVETTSRAPAAFEVVGGGITVLDNESSDTTAENYYFNGRYDRNISDRTFWYTGAGWDRNEFAGIDNRYYGEGGVGNNWKDTDDMKFSTFYGVTFTKQEDVIELAGVDDSFAGLRAGWNYMNKLSDTTTFTNDLTLDDNLDETSDWRGDMLFGLATSMSEKLALKVGLQLLYDNEPSFESIPFTPLVGPVATTNNQLDELDTIFTASLVVNFK